VKLLSLRDGFNPSTPTGRLTRNVLASVAQFETEVRRERQMAGIAAAKAAGKTFGGSKPGRRLKVSVEKEKAVKELYASGQKIAEIARALGFTRQTVYRVLGLWTPPPRPRAEECDS
jgi:DNA invertase Pin-like site-specific DNA recombinase